MLAHYYFVDDPVILVETKVKCQTQQVNQTATSYISLDLMMFPLSGCFYIGLLLHNIQFLSNVGPSAFYLTASKNKNSVIFVILLEIFNNPEARFVLKSYSF